MEPLPSSELGIIYLAPALVTPGLLGATLTLTFGRGVRAG